MVTPSMDTPEVLGKLIQQADPDMIRTLLHQMVQMLMHAEADTLCGAGYRERSPDRSNKRNGYRLRDWDTRLGTIPLSIPKLRQGTYFPDWLLEPRRRSEKAMVSVVAEAYVLGVSTRKVERLAKSLGILSLSKSQASEMAKELDTMVEQFRSRPLDAGPYRYMWLDAVSISCREGGRVASVAVVIATAVNADGHREILGVDLFTTEDGAGWTQFLRSLVTRGLSGVLLVTSDAHKGLKAAIASVLPGTSWQRCRTHFMRNLLTRVPKKAQGFVGSVVRSIFSQGTPQDVWRQHAQVVEQLEPRCKAAADLLDEAAHEILSFTAFPKTIWRQIWSNNPQERLNREVKRRTDVVGIFPNRPAVIRLIGALLAEQNDEWVVARRYMSREVLAQPPTPDTDLMEAKGDQAKLLQPA